VTTTLKSLASSVPLVDVEVAWPVGTQQRLVADQGYMSFEDLPAVHPL